MILIPNQQSSVTLYHTSNNSECKCLRYGFRTEEVQRVLACFGYIYACVYVCSKSMSRAAPLSLHSAYVLSHSRCFFPLLSLSLPLSWGMIDGTLSPQTLLEGR